MDGDAKNFPTFLGPVLLSVSGLLCPSKLRLKGNSCCGTFRILMSWLVPFDVFEKEG